MAGITANSNSVTMGSGDTSADNTQAGFLAAEQVTLATSPAGSAYQWAISGPAGNTATLDDDDIAGPKFTPDIAGYYTITCTVDSATTYILRVTVVNVGHFPVVSGIRLPELTDAQVPTPASGVTFYNSTTQGRTATKDSDGTVAVVASGAPQHATMYVSSAAATDMTLANPSKVAGTTTAENLSSDFTMPANNRILYSGTVSRHAHIAVSISMTCAANNQVTNWIVYKNGSPLTSSKVARKIGTGADVGSTAVHADTPIVSGDYLELWCENESSTANITCEYMYFFVLAPEAA